jgi:imidazolonepropionase-like amidohydrolase
MLDLEGKIVVPGFIDSHVHFISGGLQVLYIQTHSLNDSMFFSFLWVLNANYSPQISTCIC